MNIIELKSLQMTSTSNNILHNDLNETAEVSVPVLKHMIIDPPIGSIHNGLSSMISIDGYQQVENKKKKKLKREITTSTIKKKRTHYQTNMSSPVAPSSVPTTPAPINAENAQQVIGVHSKQYFQQEADDQSAFYVHKSEDVQCNLGDVQVQDDLSSSHQQQILISTESTRYAQTRYPFPPFTIRFTTGKIISNQIKEGLTAYCAEKFNTEINMLNCRLSNRSTNNEYDYLIFFKRCCVFFFSIRFKSLAN